MKNFYPILCAGITYWLISIFISSSLQAQTRLDSTYEWSFFSRTDSTLNEKTVCTYGNYKNSPECYNFSSCVISSYNANTDRWIPVRKYEERTENNGQYGTFTNYEWDASNKSWIPQTKGVSSYLDRSTDFYRYEWDEEKEAWQAFIISRDQRDGNGRWIEFEFLRYDFSQERWSGTREEISYTQAGQRAERLEKIWDYDSQDWIPSGRDSFTYDGFGRRTLTKREYWRADRQDWELEWLDEDRYDSFGKRIFSLFQNFRDFEERQEEFIYDSKGRDSVYIVSYRNNPLISLAPTTREERFYDERDLPILLESYRWEQDKWELNGSTSREFNDQGRQIRSETIVWEEDSMDFILLSFEETLVDSFGRDLGTTFLYRNLNDNRLYGWKSVQAYDNNGRNTLSIYSEYNTDSMRFLLRQRYENGYDASGNRNFNAYYNWNDNLNDWLGERKFTYLFNASGNRTREADYIWDLSTNDWALNTAKKVNWGTCKEDNPATQDGDKVRIHPNPAAEGILFIDSDLFRPYEYEIISSDGRSLIKGSSERKILQIDISSLNSGLYVIQSWFKDTKVQKKFIVHNP
ncbi:MAG: T9SS type A sorting domain-containing protein [Bacteroidota bacterium]